VGSWFFSLLVVFPHSVYLKLCSKKTFWEESRMVSQFGRCTSGPAYWQAGVRVIGISAWLPDNISSFTYMTFGKLLQGDKIQNKFDIEMSHKCRFRVFP